jgi:hypothetical protein
MARGIAARALAGGHHVSFVGTGFVTSTAADRFGDDDDTKRTVTRLVRDGSLRPIDAGPLRTPANWTRWATCTWDRSAPASPSPSRCWAERRSVATCMCAAASY